MYSNKKTTNKFLITSLIVLTTINLLAPAAKAQIEKNKIKIAEQHFNQEVQCLAENIYYESGNQTFEGKLAIAQVTINRVNSGKFPSTICGVVKQKNEINGRTICQFSWVCNQVYNLVRNKYQWEESVIVANKSLTTEVAHDILYKEKAMYFHANYVNPGWNLPRITQIGSHIFYKEKK